MPGFVSPVSPRSVPSFARRARGAGGVVARGASWPFASPASLLRLGSIKNGNGWPTPIDLESDAHSFESYSSAAETNELYWLRFVYPVGRVYPAASNND